MNSTLSTERVANCTSRLTKKAEIVLSTLIFGLTVFMIVEAFLQGLWTPGFFFCCGIACLGSLNAGILLWDADGRTNKRLFAAVVVLAFLALACIVTCFWLAS